MEYIGNVILPEGILWGAKVCCVDGKIKEVVPNVTGDTKDLPYIAPGYIDIHNHGALGHDYMEATAETFRLVAGSAENLEWVLGRTAQEVYGL